MMALLVACLCLFFFGATLAIPVATSSIESSSGPLAACASAGLRVCRFYITTDQPLLSVTASLSLLPNQTAAMIYQGELNGHISLSASLVRLTFCWHADPAGTNFPPTNPPTALCDTYVAGGSVGVNETTVRFNAFGPAQIDASWFFLVLPPSCWLGRPQPRHALTSSTVIGCSQRNQSTCVASCDKQFWCCPIRDNCLHFSQSSRVICAGWNHIHEHHCAAAILFLCGLWHHQHANLSSAV
jgi:hypothetical protein